MICNDDPLFRMLPQQNIYFSIINGDNSYGNV
jgi:hypothetical protein